MWPAYQRIIDAITHQEQEKSPLFVKNMGRSVQHMAWLLDVSAHCRAHPATTSVLLQEWIDELADVHKMIMNESRQLHREGQFILAFDLASMLPLHMPLPAVTSIAWPAAWIEYETQVRLWPPEELSKVTGVMAESLPYTLHWQWLRHLVNTLECPAVLLSLDFLHVPAPSAAGGLPTTQDQYDALLQDMVDRLWGTRDSQSLTRSALLDLSKKLPTGLLYYQFQRRFAAHILGQQWPLLSEEQVVLPVLNAPRLAGLRALFPLSRKGGNNSVPPQEQIKPRRYGYARHVTLLPQRIETLLQSGGPQKNKVVRARTKTYETQAASSTQGVPAPVPLGTSLDMDECRAEARSTTYCEEPQIQADALVGRHVMIQTGTRRPPVLATESLAQLLPTIIQTLLRPRTSFNEDNITVLVRPDMDTLALVMATVFLKVEQVGHKEAVNEGRCFWLLQEDVRRFLDLGCFFNGLMAYCRAAGTSPLTWILTALVSRSCHSHEEEALWQSSLDIQKKQAAQEHQGDRLPCPLLTWNAHPPNSFRLNGDAVVQWIVQVVGSSPSFNPLMAIFNQASSGLDRLLWTQPEATVRRLFHMTLERLPYATLTTRRDKSDNLRYVLDGSTVAMHRIETGEELGSFFHMPPVSDKRLFVNLLFSERSPPPVCWTRQ